MKTELDSFNVVHPNFHSPSFNDIVLSNKKGSIGLVNITPVDPFVFFGAYIYHFDFPNEKR